ncbi:MAG: orotate phosphoribosyltransferase [Chlamydiota bacterium]
MLKQQLIESLYQIQAIKFGNFTLKSGALSPIYFDLRLITSYPTILKQVSDLLFKKINSLTFDIICGVPYTAIPIATALSIRHDLSMVLKRKEAKDHGMKKMVEGAFTPGQTCLIIEDVITSGMSIAETIVTLKAEGLNVADVAVVLDREQQGKEKLEAQGLTVHSLLTLSEVLRTLDARGHINAATLEEVRIYAKL